MPDKLKFLDLDGDGEALTSLATVKALAGADGFWYVASPYTQASTGDTPDTGLMRAAAAAAHYTSEIVAAGLVALSPIVHSHVLASGGKVPALDHAFWMKQDAPLLAAAVGMIILPLPGWTESRGIAHEIDVCRRANKAVFVLQMDEGDAT